MKNIILLFFLSLFVCSVSAQTFISPSGGAKGSKSYVYNGTAAKGDTVKIWNIKNYDFFSASLFNTFQAQVTLDTITGKPKAKLYIYQSFDYVKWYAVDSTISITGGITGITAKSTLFAPYARVSIRGIDSTQKTLVQKIITVIKND
jgi:hypothetical protein